MASSFPMRGLTKPRGRPYIPLPWLGAQQGLPIRQCITPLLEPGHAGEGEDAVLHGGDEQLAGFGGGGFGRAGEGLKLIERPQRAFVEAEVAYC